MLVLYTDGVTEAENAHGAEYGVEKLRASFRKEARGVRRSSLPLAAIACRHFAVP